MALREVRELGRGAFGRVYLAYDDERGMQVAVKELLDPEADLDRFGREARMLADQIHNIYVVNIYTWDLNAPRPYIVLEYCERGSLRSQVGKETWRGAATVLLHAANGLLGIHNAGGFHRDIKPENLLIARIPDSEYYVIKLADFGLARRPQTALPPMTVTPAGTPGYIAPEAMLPGAQFSAQCDIFSLGVVGIELMTGQRSPDSLDFMDAPDEFKKLLVRMTSDWPFLRPSTADLIIELGRILNAAAPNPPAPQPPPPQLPAPRPAPRAPAPRAPAPAPAPARSDGGGAAAWLVVLGALAAATALAAGDKSEWDDNVGRYRGNDGRFKKR